MNTLTILSVIYLFILFLGGIVGLDALFGMEFAGM
jgi:hypothetical protein